MNIKLFFAFILFCVTSLSIAQSKKEIKKYKIKSITETISIMEKGKSIVYKDHYILFDKNGEIVEEIEYNRDGSVKKKQLVKYDNNDNKIEETSFHQGTKNPGDGKTNLKIIYKYNANNDKTEEHEYDSGKLVKRKIYSYNNKGERTLEEVYSAEGKLLRKAAFSYEKGFKKEKKIFNGQNALEMTKTYAYEF